ncbi:MAG: membrane protein insertase YidC [Gammaproteobacteria bacterium]|nr:membrane protein insertase YidC [Gammaproteobacteria bacterium]
MDNVRLLLAVALAFISLLLWEAWQKDYGVNETVSATAVADDLPADAPPAAAEVPTLNTRAPTAETTASTTRPELAVDVAHESSNEIPRIIVVETDLLSMDISSVGGTITRVALLAYPIRAAARDKPVELLTEMPENIFIYQGGLAGSEAAPNHHVHYSIDETYHRLDETDDELVVSLAWSDAEGHEVVKRFKFKRGSYLIEVEYELHNGSDESWRVYQYEQLQRSDVSGRDGMVYTFTGAALSTPDKRFEKFDYDDLEDSPIDEAANDAWIGVMQHYFIAALIPPKNVSFQYYSKILPSSRYLVGFVSPPAEIAPGTTELLRSTTYIGPKRHDIIAQITPGLELSVDYGVLWFIAKPLFMVLEYIHGLTGNWGWGIIILTLILKIFFYPLSAAGYRSMANMRKVQPRLIALRDRFANDKTQLNQAMMKLYKEEKINPLGGCFPILIQIPVFISLYWVLLESVEIRQAPFILWIYDLSEKDPFFVLPLLMGISMWLQQKLNPAPLDPTQAKVMQILPFVFTGFFAFFPSGLVLYWLVNNILSIAQQWRITRIIERE